MIGWFLRHPVVAGVLVGLLVAIGFGVFSFPRESEIHKTITDWRPGDSTLDQETVDELIEELERAREGEAELRQVSEEEFRDLNLDRSVAYPEASDDESGFTIRYIGEHPSDEDVVYLAERTVEPGPWWSPDRLLYRAARAEVDRFSDGLRLTYERDWKGLAGLLILDAIVGWIYGTVIGLVLATIGARDLTVPAGPAAPRPPPEAKPGALGKGRI